MLKFTLIMTNFLSRHWPLNSVMNRKRSKYSSEMPAIWLRRPRNKVNNALALFCSSISLLDIVYVVHFPFDATMEFNDRELSPDTSRSDRSSVEFVAETPGPDWEDDPSTIVLSDNKEGPPKLKKKTPMEYFTPTPRSTLQSNSSLTAGAQMSLYTW